MNLQGHLSSHFVAEADKTGVFLHINLAGCSFEIAEGNLRNYQNEMNIQATCHGSSSITHIENNKRHAICLYHKAFMHD